MSEGVFRLIELKRFTPDTWKPNFKTELGFKVGKTAAGEASDVIPGQLLNSLVRHVESIRKPLNFPQSTGYLMAPSVLRGGDTSAKAVDDLTTDMNQFVFDYIERNANKIAKDIYGLDINADDVTDAVLDEWDSILEAYRTELITKKYIQIDTLSNLTG